MISEQVNHQGEILAAAIEGGMNDALSIGNNDLVRLQFRKLKVKMPDIEVAVCDFEQIVSFATDLNLVKKPLGAMVKTRQTRGSHPNNGQCADPERTVPRRSERLSLSSASFGRS